MKTVVIIGSTYQVAKEELESKCSRAGVTMKKDKFIAEASIDGQRIVAIGGSVQDVCWLRDLGFNIEEIIVIEPDLISEEMRKRINHVQSTIALGR